MDTFEAVKIDNLPDGKMGHLKVSKSEKLMSFLLNTSTSPNNLYLYDLENKKLEKLTDTHSDAIDEEDLVAATK